MATNVTIISNYITDNISNSDSTTPIGSSSSSGEDTPERILEKLKTVDSDDSGLNANTLQGKTAAEFATPAMVTAAVAALVDSSPSALNTLNELAAAMGDDPNFATTVTNSIAGKLSLDGGVMNNTNRVINLNADLLHGLNLVDTGNNWGGITQIGNDGVMEVGKYLDFHETDTATNDFDARLHSTGGVPYWNGQQMWHSGNDGAGSGLDADLLNGINSDSFFRKINQTITNNTDANTLNQFGNYFNTTGNGTGNSNFPSNYGIFNVFGQNEYYFTQENTNYDGNITHRVYWNGIGFSPWSKIYDSSNSNLPTIDWSAKDLTFSNSIQGDTAFSSGFQGSGMRLNKDANNKYNLELDNLTVRGGMSVYELTANKVRATNGALYVSDSNKIKSVDVLTSYYVIYTEDINTFTVGDIVKCQIFTGTGVKSYTALIDYVDNSRSLFTLSFATFYQGGTGANIPAIGDTLVRIGNNTDTNRQGTIYLTSSDTNSPYIQVVDNATSANLAGDVKVRLGKLDGITSTAFGNLTGYGLFTNNAILDNARVSGNISANSGNIGKFYIDGDYLGNDNIQMYNPNVNEGYIRFRIEENTGHKRAGLQFESLNLLNRTTVDRGSMKFHYESGYYRVRFKAPYMNIGDFAETKFVFLDASDYIGLNSNNNVSINATNIVGINATNGVAITAPIIQLKGNQTVSGNLTVGGIAYINLPTYTLTYNTVGAWPSFSSLVFNGRMSGNVYNLNLTFYSSNSSNSWQKLGTITNYSTIGYDIYFTPTTGSGLSENSAGYISTTGEIFIKPGKGGQNYTGQVTWIIG